MAESIPSLVYFLSVAVGVLLQPGEAEPLVAPVLSEVAVHRIVLKEGRGDPLFIHLWLSPASAGWSNWISLRKWLSSQIPSHLLIVEHLS